MGRSDIEDPKLTEVKAILARLQRIDPDDDATFDLTPPPPLDVATTVELQRLDLPVANAAAISDPQHSQFRLGAALLAGCATAALVLFMSKSFWLSQPTSSAVSVTTLPAALPPSTSKLAEPAPLTVAARPMVSAPSINENNPVVAPLPPAPPSLLSGKAALQAADRMISAGRIKGGREELLRIAPENSADVAWALARAFDPNVVSRIDNADAKPDVAEATKWYRQWHTLAIKQGLVADSISIERIIRSMGR